MNTRSLLFLVIMKQFISTETFAASQTCDTNKMRELLTMPDLTSEKKDFSTLIDCNLDLSSNQVIKRQLLLEGDSSSNITLDCHGATLEGSNSFESIIIRSKAIPNTNSTINNYRSVPLYSRPQNIVIKNCYIKGSVRIYGMNASSDGEPTLASSRFDIHHTERAQQAAPQHILLLNNTFEGTGKIPLYLSQGVMNVVVDKSIFKGFSNSTVIYLDAESKQNIIRNSTFNTDTRLRDREVIAIDGSAENQIIGNVFQNQDSGAIHIYRNCGEDGVVRILKPTDNIIKNNTFNQTALTSLIIGSRKADSVFCDADNGVKYGSSINNFDWVDGTLISNNHFKVNCPNHKVFNRFIASLSVQSNTVMSSNKITSYSSNKKQFSAAVKGAFIDEGGNDVSIIDQSAQKQIFDCSVLDNDAGCNKVVSCPQGKKIVSISAICNLEEPAVDGSKLKIYPEGILAVTRNSDHVGDGYCAIDDVNTQWAGQPTKRLNGKTSVHVKCHEHDGRGGGDCAVHGEMWCK